MSPRPRPNATLNQNTVDSNESSTALRWMTAAAVPMSRRMKTSEVMVPARAKAPKSLAGTSRDKAINVITCKPMRPAWDTPAHATVLDELKVLILSAFCFSCRPDPVLPHGAAAFVFFNWARMPSM
jgi:hypothetical protein